MISKYISVLTIGLGELLWALVLVPLNWSSLRDLLAFLKPHSIYSVNTLRTLPLFLEIYPGDGEKLAQSSLQSG